MMLRTNAKLAEEKATAVATKKKERSELRGELKKRQSKYEKEYAENSKKLIDPMQSRVQMGSSALQETCDARCTFALRVGVAPVSIAAKHKRRGVTR